jgi:hypothetical protein
VTVAQAAPSIVLSDTLLSFSAPRDKIRLTTRTSETGGNTGVRLSSTSSPTQEEHVVQPNDHDPRKWIATDRWGDSLVRQ